MRSLLPPLQAFALVLLAGCASAPEPTQCPDCVSAATTATAAIPPCDRAGLTVEVLGSGGPIAGTDGRRSTFYIIWLNGKARLLVDLGGGATHAFGATGAKVEDLDAVLLSHLHVDHAGDLDTFIKSATFGPRTAALPIIGPSGDGVFVSVADYVRSLFGEGGPFAYLSVLSGEPFLLVPTVIDASKHVPAVALETHRFRVRALSVPHGPVPALAYEVTAPGGQKIVFMSDQRADDPAFVGFSRGADLLVAHMAIGQDTDGAAAKLHAKPAQIGKVAHAAGAKRLLLSHLMPRALADLDGNVAQVSAAYKGPVTVAADGLCLPLGAPL